MTTEETAIELQKINDMSHHGMCELWRFAPVGHPWFDNRNTELVAAFKARLYDHFGGFTPGISKDIGWQK